ncbi:unnamed protein product [Closterium sp. Naga37s-1]|nr:unnamed protein product [Closterium sp. Naga37s-1]
MRPHKRGWQQRGQRKELTEHPTEREQNRRQQQEETGAGGKEATKSSIGEGRCVVALPIIHAFMSVRDDLLLHCPSSVCTLVKRHVYSRFVNSSYLFAGTSNIFRVSEGATMLPPSHAAALPCGRPPMRPPSHAAALPCCRPPMLPPSHPKRPYNSPHPSDNHLTTRANVDFFPPHVDLVAGNSTTELLIIASGQAQVLVRGKNGNEMQWFVLHEGDCVGEIACLRDLTELWTVRTLSVCRVLSISRDDYRSVARTHPADDRHGIANLLNRARSRAEATARFYPGNSTMAELSLLLKNEVEPVLNGIDIFFFYPLSHTFANRSLAPTPSSPTLPHSPCHASLSAFTASSVGAAMRPCRDVFHFLHPGFHTLPAHSVPIPVMFLHRSSPPLFSSPLASPSATACVVTCWTAGGFDVAAADYNGRTPMHLAAVTGQDKVVAFLLAHGAQVNAKDAFWRTPLQEAVAAGHWSTAQILRRSVRSAIALPLLCHCSAIALPLLCLCSAIALPLLCLCSATFLPDPSKGRSAARPGTYSALRFPICSVPSLLLTCWHSTSLFPSLAHLYYSSHLSPLPFSLHRRLPPPFVPPLLPTSSPSHQGMTQPRNHRKHTCHLACSTTTTRRAFHSPSLPPFQSCR